MSIQGTASFASLEERMIASAEKTELALSSYLNVEFAPEGRRKNESFRMNHPSVKRLLESMSYSTLSGGKRIRPYLTLAFCKMFGGDEDIALVFACALEMVHTYSLIHDDLPCVDNDDLRRGLPTNHKVYGEAGALFAGDALLTYAFEVIASANVLPHIAVRAVRMLSEGAGHVGMLGGQMADKDAENQTLSIEELSSLHDMKTGALIRTAARFGCLAASVDDEDVLEAVDSYASDIGLAFQIVDDVLDKYGDSTLLGKNVGSDTESCKNTFLSFYSKDDAMREAERLTNRAICTISAFEGAEEAILLARYLLQRNK